MTREVEDNCNVGSLAGDAGAGSAGNDRCADGTACGDGGFDVGCIAGQDNADRKLTVV